jgi:membrane protease YdiL (CAAX protease family)
MPRALWWRVPLALVLGLAVFVLAGSLSHTLGPRILGRWAAHEWISTSLFQVLMLAIALLAMLLIGRGQAARFGLRSPARIDWIRMALAVIVLQVAVTLLFLPFAVSGPGHFAEGFSFLEIVIGVWVIASTCEEVVSRGLVQGYLQPLAGYGIQLRRLRLSVPVLVGAAFFAAMHIPLLVMGIATLLGVQILISAFVLGLIAGHFRERSGSLLPAIAAHSFANIVGMGLELVSGWLS